MKGALVTGAGMRIGRAFATALAADGFFVFVHHHRSAAAARETVAAITAAGGKAKAVRADLSSAKQAESLVGRCQAKGVQLTCLVNSASLFELDRAPMATAAGFDRHMAVNLRAPLLLSQALARQLPDRETGVIVNVLDQKLLSHHACAWPASRPASPCAAAARPMRALPSSIGRTRSASGSPQKISCAPCGLWWRHRATLAMC